MNKTAIGWTDYSSNPIRAIDQETGKAGWWCEKVSPGCAHCYAETLNKRWGTGHAYLPANRGKVRFELKEAELAAWRKYEAAVVAGKKPPIMMFIGDMLDLGHNLIPATLLFKILDTIAECPHIIFQLLTKRIERLGAVIQIWMWDAQRTTPLPNLWLGVSVENPYWAEKRIPQLLRTPAAVRFLSCEPLLSWVNLYLYCHPTFNDAGRAVFSPAEHGLHWVIVGGESGPHHRPFDPEWARCLRNQCDELGVAFFFKQGAGRLPGRDRVLDGQEYDAFPVVAA